MPQARNNDELRKVLKPALRDAVDYVVQKLWNENRDVVEQVVYRQQTPSTYNRTNQFANAWETAVHDAAHIKADAEGGLFYKPSLMDVGSTNHDSADYGQHIGVANPYYGKDSREYLADIIYQGLAGPAFGDGYWRKKRDAWAELNKRVGKLKMKQWCKEGLTYAGLDVVMHAAAIEYTEE